MEGVLRIEESNIVLKVKTNFDPSRLNLNEWDKYLDCLCGNREYQKEAIKAAVIYMASGEYESINHLAKENYVTNNALQQKYSKEIDLINSIQLPNKLSGVIDLATGTGKSFVLYGIAQIMLAIGLVKRVLLLCPSAARISLSAGIEGRVGSAGRGCDRLHGTYRLQHQRRCQQH